MPRIPRWLRLPRSRARIRADVDAELRFDIEMRARDLVKHGLSPGEAQARATAEFGDLDGTRRYCEDMDMDIEADARRANLLEDLRADIVIAWRAMRRTPTFVAVVLLTLALGIGANTAVFSVVRRVLLAPLPFRSPEQLYRLYTAPNATDGDDDKLSAVELTELATESRSIAGLTLFGNYGGVAYSDDQTADAWQSVSVAPNFFDVLGIQPVAGRVFDADDFVQGAPSVAMITYQIWQRVFGGDPRLAGRIIQLNGRPTTVIGVLPERFVGPTFTTDVLRPLNVAGVMQSASYARSRVWRAVARLKPGVSLEQFRAELAVLQHHIQAAHPDIKHAGVVIPTPLHEAIVGGAGPVLRLVMAGALVVLLATCLNVAGLFLSRTVARRRELGVRTALGAGRGRLVRQVLTESLLYGVAGGVAGVLLATVLKSALVHAAGRMLPKLGDVRIDGGVLAFALLAAVSCGLAFGLVPALSATNLDVREALGDAGSRAASQGSSASRLSRLLVSIQIAVAVVLVVGAGLLTRTFMTLVDTNLGYETTAHQATFFLSLGARYRELPAQRAFVESFVQRAHALPGVTAVGYTVTGPWNGTWRNVSFRIDGRRHDGTDAPSVVLASASAEYFAAVGMPIRMGRGFNAGDRLGSPPVVVISESMARRYWPNASPIGARLYLQLGMGDPNDTLRAREVVGVVSDVKQDALSETLPTLYVSAEQTQLYGAAFVVRARGDVTVLIPALKETIHAMDPRVPLVSPRTLHEVLSDLVRRQTLAMILIGMFAALALLLAGLGVYGIMAYSVVARTREFGVRAALGATRRAILLLVLRQGVATIVGGVVAGLLVAAVLTKLIASLLVGVTTHDVLSFVVASVVLVVAALAACIVPARAATRVSPVEALRGD